RNRIGRDNRRNHGTAAPSGPFFAEFGVSSGRESMRPYSFPFAGAAGTLAFLSAAVSALSPASPAPLSSPSAGGAASTLIFVPSGNAYPPAVITGSFSLMPD